VYSRVVPKFSFENPHNFDKFINWLFAILLCSEKGPKELFFYIEFIFLLRVLLLVGLEDGIWFWGNLDISIEEVYSSEVGLAFLWGWRLDGFFTGSGTRCWGWG
jgi:hypothetical protein